MKYDLELIKKELSTLLDYDNQLYLQGDTLDMMPDEPIENYLLVTRQKKIFGYFYLIYHILILY